MKNRFRSWLVFGLVFMAALAAALAAAPVPALANTAVLDINQPLWDFEDPLAGTCCKVGQTFKPTQRGELTQIGVALGRNPGNPSATTYVELWSGQPGQGQLLGTSNTITTTTSPIAMTAFTFNPAITVEAGQTYTFTISQSGIYAVNYGWGDTLDRYTDGAHYLQQVDGQWFQIAPQEDMAFEIWLIPRPLNQAPTITLGTAPSVFEDAPAQTLTGWATNISAVEADQTLTVTLTNNNNALFSSQPAIDKNSGTLTFTPALNANGSALVTVTVQDSGGTANGGQDTTVKTFTIPVNAVNDAPSFAQSGGNQTVNEDAGAQSVATFATAISAGPTDEAGQTLTFQVTANSNPSLFSAGPAISSTGTLTYTSALNASGTATITYVLRDSGGTANGGADTSAPQNFSITVNAVNDAPAIAGLPGTLTTNEEQAATLNLSVTDVDAGGASLLASLSVTNGTLSLGSTAGLTMQSGGSGQAAASFTGTLASVNAALTGLTYRPNPNYFGSDTLTVTVSDQGNTGSGGAQTDTKSAAITVEAVNDAPSFSKGADQEVAEGSGAHTAAGWATQISAGPANEAGQTLSFTLTPSNGALFSVPPSVDAVSGDLTYTLADFAFGTTTVTATLTDNGGTDRGGANSATQSFTITVTEVNDVPQAAGDTLTAVNEDSAPRVIAIADLLANDSPGPANESGQTLTLVGVSGAAGGTVAFDATTVTFTLTPDFSGSASFTYTVRDNGTTDGAADPLEDTATVSFTVNPTAEAPAVTAATTAEDTQSSAGLVITPDAADGAGVTHFAITGITGGWLYKNDGTTLVTNGQFVTAAEGAAGLRFTPIANLNTPAGDTFEFTVSAALDAGGTGMGPGTTVTITVSEVNDAPTGANDTLADIAEDSGARTILAADLLANDSKGPANESGQTLSITAADNAFGGTVDVVGGNVVFTPTANYAGPASFRYTLTDNGTTNGAANARSSTADVTFAITPMPDAPQATSATTAEDSQSAAGLVITPNALDGAEVTHFQVTAITGGRLYQSNGTTEITAGSYMTAAQGGAGLKFTPAADLNSPTGGTFSFTVKAALDAAGTGLSGGTTVSITVTEVNDAPTGVADLLTAVSEDSAALTIPFATLTGNDSSGPANESGQTLTITAVTALVGGSVAIENGEIVFTPAANFHGTATFTYTVADNGTTNGAADAKTGTATVSIPVTPVADTPLITAAATAEDTKSASGLVITRSLVDGAEVTHFQITGITGGRLYQPDGTTEITNGSYITAAAGGAGLRFAPAADTNTPAGDTFTFTVKAALDGAGAGLSAGGAAPSITVTEVNDAPDGVNDTLTTVAEDSGPWTIPFTALTGNDSPGPVNEAQQALTVIAVSGATGGTVALSGTDVIFTPTAHFNGTASFTYTLQDNGTTNGSSDVKTATATASFPVTPVNDVPQAADDTLTAVNEDSAPRVIAIADLVANDSPGPANESGQTLTLVGVSGAVGGTVGFDTTTITFTLTPDFSGTASFTYTVRDNGTTNSAADPLEDTATVSFTVNPTAEAPAGTAATTAEDTQSSAGLVITPDAADGAGVTHFAISGITGGWLYKSNGTTQIANGDFITAAEGAAGLKFTPVADLNTPAGDTFSFTVRAAMDAAGTGMGPGSTVTITVSEVNDAPTGANDTLADIAEDSGPRTVLAADLLDNDSKGPANESGQTLSITAADNAFGGTVAVEDGNVVFTPTANYAGPASFRYTLTDNGTTNGAANAKSSTADVTFTITPMPDAPQATSATTAEDTQSTAGLVITRNALDGAEVTHFQVTAITGGRLYQSNGTTEITAGSYITAAQGGSGLKFTPAADLNSPTGGTFSFTAKAALDAAGTGLSDETTVSITVTEVNDAPTGVDDTLANAAEDAAEFAIPFATLTGNDSTGPANESGQTLTVSAVSAPVGGSVRIEGGTVRFTPAADFVGPAQFTYTLQDDGTTAGAANGQTAAAVARFTITEVNDAPAGAADALADRAEDSGPWTIPFADLLANDSTGPANESGQTLTIISVDSAAGGTVVIVGTDLIFTPTLNFNGTAGFTYTLEDDGTTAGVAAPLTATGGVAFTVTPVNDRPVAQNLARAVVVNGTLTGQVAATDVDGDPLTYALAAAPAKGTVTLNASGAFTYRSNAVGTDSFTFKANDGTADSDPGTVTITVEAEPVEPVLTLTVPVTETREASIVVSGSATPYYFVAVSGTTVQADGLGQWSAAVALTEGPNLITASSSYLVRSVTVVRDTTPPVLTLTASATRTEENTVVLTAVSEEGARIEIEGAELSTLTVPLKMGQNRFTATAADRLGNTTTATVSVLRVGKVPEQRRTEAGAGQPAEAATQYFSVRVPGRAVAQPIVLQIVSPSADAAAIELAEGAAQVAMTGHSAASTQRDGDTVDTFDAPVTVSFIYDPARVSNPDQLRIYYFDPEHNVWVELGGVVDATTNTITVQVEHFTTFAAMAPQQDAPIIDPLPARVTAGELTVTGTFRPDSPVTLVINGSAQRMGTTDAAGRFTLQGDLMAGRNFIYVKGAGVLASREWTVRYSTIRYTDIGGHWAESMILDLADRQIASIYPEPLFGPEERVTRLEFAVMVARVLGLAPVQEAPPFTDTDAMAAWARPEVTAAVRAGIIKGMPDGSFAPNALVTRAEMAVMLARALHYAGLDNAPGGKRFTDGEQIPDWARDQVLTAAGYGLITGYPDGSFQHRNSTTRGEAVTMLGRLLRLLSSQ